MLNKFNFYLWIFKFFNKLGLGIIVSYLNGKIFLLLLKFIYMIKIIILNFIFYLKFTLFVFDFLVSDIYI
jgi:hypothetical protein